MRAKLSKPFSIHDIKYKGHADERFKGKRLELHSDFKTALNFAKDLTWCILNMKCHIMSRSLVNTRKKNAPDGRYLRVPSPATLSLHQLEGK